MRPPGSLRGLAVLLVACCLFVGHAAGRSLIVNTGYELHAALASSDINSVYVARNITLTIDTCPFPSSDEFSATLISRNVTITSLPRGASGAADVEAGSSDTAAWPYHIFCNYLTDRFEIKSGYQLTLSHLVLVHCRTWSLAGIFRKAKDAVVRLDSCVEQFGEVCLPPEVQKAGIEGATRPAGVSSPPTQQQQQQQQLIALSEPGSNWCAAAAAGGTGSGSSMLGFPYQSPISSNSSSSLCTQQALLLGDVALTDTATNTSKGTKGEPFTFHATNSAALCSQPVSPGCIAEKQPAGCLTAAYDAINPDVHGPCAVTDGFSMHSCLTSPSVGSIMLIQSATMNLTTCPAQEEPALLTRSITIFSDPRAPRLTWDCGLLSNRFQLAPNLTLTLHHIILANCSTSQPLSIIRLSAGSRVLVNDSIILQPPGLCMPLQEQASSALHSSRPAGVAGVQSILPGVAGGWCAHNDSDGPGSRVEASDGAADNSSYSAIRVTTDNLGLFANTTGFGPTYAATLSGPASVLYYVHPSWPGMALCNQSALIFKDFAYTDQNSWQNASEAAAAAAAGSSNTSSPTPPQQQEQQGQVYGSDVDAVDGFYSGTFVMRYTQSALLCLQPILAAACPDIRNSSACLAAAYQNLNPDRLMEPGAAAYRAAEGQRKRHYGVAVVLPAVLASVLGMALIALGTAYVICRRRRATGVKAAADAKKKWLLPFCNANDTPTTASSMDPARRLLGIHRLGYSPGPSSGNATQSGTTSLASSGPDGIALDMLLGAGSFGRVYAATWNNAPVAVKIIMHSSADDARISQELALSLSFDHPNLVRALHFTKLRINPGSGHTSMGQPSEPGSGLFLPEGAVGVFTLPSTWAVIQRSTDGGPGPSIDTETWIVMDLMDCGNLAAAVRHSSMFADNDGSLNAVRLLRRAVDVAAGVSYLHSRNVCHGDLKCENVLLCSEPQDPDGCMAKVADFGLSRALAYGQSHLSTRRYGTVTHMPPELLVAGKLTPAADVYSFGIMMWELASRQLPFAGLHHGEIIHKVVTQDLRPSPWPAQAALPSGYVALAEACWARRASDRPSMAPVLQALLDMLAAAEQQQQQLQHQGY